jgi:hypothetical protein
LSTPDRFEIDFDAAISAWLQAQEANQRKHQNPYLLLLIRALQPSPRGRTRSEVIRVMEAERKRLGLPEVAKFEEAVQSTYNRHSEDSAVFAKKREPDEKPLFFSAHGKGSGVWGLHVANANAWIAQRLGKQTGSSNA